MLHVDKPDSMMTEPICMTATSLVPDKTYEILLKLNHSIGTLYGRGHFKADSRGVIDLAKTAPLRGTYSGVRPMGLFESLTPSDDYRFGSYCKCTPPEPFHFVLELYDDVGKLVHSLPLLKRWMHPAVVRREIEEDGICGTLFLPPGEGPFPTILDMSGTGGGINEHKGATLSSEGFCVLSLAFFQYKSLIEDMNELDMDYFKKAIDWLISQPFTRNEIGIQGVSFGGLLVNMLAVRHPEIIAVCSINGSHCLSDVAKIKEHGKFLPYVGTAVNMLQYINGAMCFSKAVQYMDVSEEADIKIETAPKRTAFRFVGSLDDLSTPTVFCSRLAEKKLKESGHYVEVDFAPGGHLMEPPYYPGLPVVYSKFAGQLDSRLYD
nr:Acyl-CoA thioester hydrolase bile acid-CoA amino acid N-acetyltransferase and BAAT Acyl-CoA thioester hydrolase C-terminal domain containing protein [Haemonchus contortus]